VKAWLYECVGFSLVVDEGAPTRVGEDFSLGVGKIVPLRVNWGFCVVVGEGVPLKVCERFSFGVGKSRPPRV
jgi:hypothetical protein